ncbi:MAG TPA: hypothetical protein VFA03_11565 [Acetobacteraceae bacterium]|nr:hypothetical protein [Acetobacteraceae bacterium]
MGYKVLDNLVKERLRSWPQRPPGLRKRAGRPDALLRGRPVGDVDACHPFLKLPGSDRLRTLPDGLWLNFGGTPAEPYVDVFAVEACGSLQNLLDKRSRFAPSTHSLLAVCPVPWLLAPMSAEDRRPRWQATGVMLREPVVQFVLPVRDIRVLYALKRDHYAGFARHQVPHAHEFYAPMEAITAKNSERDPALLSLIARATADNFLSEMDG